MGPQRERQDHPGAAPNKEEEMPLNSRRPVGDARHASGRAKRAREVFVLRIGVLGAVVFLVASLQLPARGDAGSLARIDPALARRVAYDAPGEGVLVFVHGEDVEAAQAAVRGAGFKLMDTFDSVGVAVAAGPLGGIESLSGQPRVDYLESAETPISYALDTAQTATRTDEVVDGTALGPFDGSGVTIAIVDSGIDATHPMFQTPEGSKVVRNLRLACLPAEATGDVAPPLCPKEHGADENPWVDLRDTDLADGHGTHVAGIAGGTEVVSAGRRLRGAAPGAPLVGLGMGAGVTLYGPAAALDWILENHHAPCGPGVSAAVCPPIKVVNNSYEAGGYHAYNPEGLIEKLQELLLAEGITMVWAAGNDGGDGTENMTNGLAATTTPGSIMVAAYDDADVGRRDWGLGWMSARGKRGFPETYPDVAAPGVAITSACRPTLVDCVPPFASAHKHDLDYATLSGTSMSSPHVAGIVALLLQADPALTPAMVENVLEDTARQIAFGGEYEADPFNPDDVTSPDHLTSFDKGHGLVDAVSAVAEALGDDDAPPPPERCTPTAAVATDEIGDATGVVVIQPVPSDPAVDITSMRLRWEDDPGSLTFTMGVADLQPTTAGSAFDATFTQRGDRFFIEATRSATGDEQFAFGVVTPRSRSILLEGLSGDFDSVTDRVRLTLEAGDLEEAALGPLAKGEVLTQFVVASRRLLGSEAASVAPLADAAVGTCPYTIGVGAVPPPGGQPQPPADGEVSSHETTYAWSGENLTNNASLFGCEGLSFGFGLHGEFPSGCDRELIEVTPPTGGATLEIEIRTEGDGNFLIDPLATDLDLYLFGPDGSMLAAQGVPGGNERVTKRLTEPGVYTVVVLGFQSVETAYEGDAKLLLGPGASG
jgi:subtilisin family serine protease